MKDTQNEKLRNINWFKVFSFIILTLYTMFVLWGQFVLARNGKLPVVFNVVLLAVSGSVVFIFMKVSHKLALKKEQPIHGRYSGILWFVVPLVVCLSIMLLNFIAYNPGSFTYDPINQYTQAAEGKYFDWHPAIHTLLFFTIPIKIFGNFHLIVLLQLIYYSAAVAYLIYSMRKWLCPVWFCHMTLLYICLNPGLGNLMQYPWKDGAFIIFSTWCLAFFISIIGSKGEWLTRKRNVILFSVVLGIGSLVRHNGILFTLPVLLAVCIFNYKRIKTLLCICLCFILCIILVKGPVYKLFHVMPAEQRQSEILGLCMTVLGNAIVSEPDKLDAETREFLYEIATQEQWETYYVCGSWNSMKWGNSEVIGPPGVIEKYGSKKIIGYTLRTFLRAPWSSSLGFLSLTGLVWQIDGARNWDWNTHPTVMENPFGVTYSGSAELKDFLDYCIDYSNDSRLNYIFGYVGVVNIILLYFGFSRFSSWKDLKYLLYILPVICYNFGTMLLLAGNDFRFFTYSFVVVCPILFLILRKDDTIDGMMCSEKAGTE